MSIGYTLGIHSLLNRRTLSFDTIVDKHLDTIEEIEAIETVVIHHTKLKMRCIASLELLKAVLGYSRNSKKG